MATTHAPSDDETDAAYEEFRETCRLLRLKTFRLEDSCAIETLGRATEAIRAIATATEPTP